MFKEQNDNLEIKLKFSAISNIQREFQSLFINLSYIREKISAEFRYPIFETFVDFETLVNVYHEVRFR